MTIDVSERPCPECDANLQVIYVTELKQVVSGWACPDCGFLASEKHGFEDRVPKPEEEHYVLRKESTLSSADVRSSLADVVDEFRTRASAEMADDEVWMLVDPEDGSLVDVCAGDDANDEEK
jgi:hypothetical protein